MTPVAIAARERRVNDMEIRRFNSTMRQFIEFKYDSVYEEFCVFYKSLSEKHPGKKNLLKTTTFKSWKKNIIEQAFREDGVIAEVKDLTENSDEQAEPSTDLAENSDSERNVSDEQPEPSTDLAEISDSEGNVPDEQAEPVEDILSTAISESFIEQQPILDISGLESADRVIDDIVRELERDGEIADLLADNTDYNDDEGIALDYRTELDAIVETFDFEHEVDF